MSMISLAKRHRALLLILAVVLLVVFGGLAVALAGGGGITPDGCTLPEPSKPDRCNT